MRFHIIKAAVIGSSPVGRPVFEITMLRKEIGFSATTPQPNETAPVLAEERALLQAEPLNERGHRIDVKFVRMHGAIDRLVRTAKANKIGRDCAQARCGQQRDHLAIEVAPGRLAVQQQHDLTIARAFVQIVNAVIDHILVVRLECEFRKAGKSFVRRAAITPGRTSSGFAAPCFSAPLRPRAGPRN